MLQTNSTLPDIEQLNRHEFDLDIEEQLRLQAEADQEVERVSGWGQLVSIYLGHEVERVSGWGQLVSIYLAHEVERVSG